MLVTKMIMPSWTRYYMGWKVPRFFSANRRFLSKIVFIPQHSCLQGRYTWYSDLPTWRFSSNSSKYASLCAKNSSFKLKFFPWSHYFILGNKSPKGKCGEYSGRAINSNCNLSDLAIAFKDMCDAVLSWWRSSFFIAIWSYFSLIHGSVYPIMPHNTLQ